MGMRIRLLLQQVRANHPIVCSKSSVFICIDACHARVFFAGGKFVQIVILQ